MRELDFNNKVKFIKKCLREEGYSKELIAYLLSTYDLDTYINEGSNFNHLELATHFLSHARHIQERSSY
jgi:hypothetical protein